MKTNKYDVIIIGAGIGGLTAGAILARNGKKVLILEKNPSVGGYATNFRRKGFNFECSLHLVNGGKEGPVQSILEKCGIESKIEFLKPKFLFHSIFPDFDIKIPHCDLGGLIDTLNSHFPGEKQNIGRLMKSIGEVALEMKELRGSIIDEKESTSLPLQYKASSYYLDKTWGNIIDSFLKDERLKTLLSQLWPFFGIPPTKLAAYYFSASLFDYLANGGYYISGGSGALAAALLEIIKTNHGVVLFNAKADEIILRGKEAVGVKIISNEIFLGNAIISNIDVINTFLKLSPQNNLSAQFLASLKGMQPSISAFEVHLGLNIDLSKQDSLASEYEVFLNPSYDTDKQYLAALANDMEEAPIAVTFYSNLDKTFAPLQKSYVSITALAGYDYWQQCQDKEYKAHKEMLADILIKRAQKIIPSLTSYIEVKDIATPLTMERYTNNYKGAIYGWEQSIIQSGINRTENSTPVNNLYLAGAWTRPGGGIAGVMQSGERIAEYIMRKK